MLHLFRNWGLFTSLGCHSSHSKTFPGTEGSVKYLSPSNNTLKMWLIGCWRFYLGFFLQFSIVPELFCSLARGEGNPPEGILAKSVAGGEWGAQQ